MKPESEKQIIERLLKEEHFEDKSMSLKSNSGKAGEKKYLLHSKWWNQWCDYVNFNLGPSYELIGDDQEGKMIEEHRFSETNPKHQV